MMSKELTATVTHNIAQISTLVGRDQNLEDLQKFIPCNFHNSGKYLCCDCASIQMLKSKINLETLRKEVAVLQETIDTILDNSLRKVKVSAVNVISKDDLPEYAQNNKQLFDGIRLLQSEMLIFQIRNKKQDIRLLSLKVKNMETRIISNLKLKDKMFKKNLNLPLNNSSLSFLSAHEQSLQTVHKNISETDDKIQLFKQVLERQKHTKFKELTEWVNITYSNKHNCYYFNNTVPIPQYIKTVFVINTNTALWQDGQDTQEDYVSSTFLLEYLERFLKTCLQTTIDTPECSDFERYSFQYKSPSSKKSDLENNKLRSNSVTAKSNVYAYDALISRLTFIVFACYKILQTKKQLLPAQGPTKKLSHKLARAPNTTNMGKTFSNWMLSEINYLGKLVHATCQPWNISSPETNNLRNHEGSRSYNVEYIRVPAHYFDMQDQEVINHLQTLLAGIVDEKNEKEKWMLVK